jgi:UDP-GlcNAc3NAcA epimerase
MKTIYTVVGARPQFIKAYALSAKLADLNARGGDIAEKLIHTGQHYDSNMSDVFFQELSIPPPHLHLNIHGGAHGAMTARMLSALEAVFSHDKPSAVLVYGDTNSTLAAALAAVKLHIPVMHVEAGLRSFNMRMPEEVNRILTDKISTRLYCPSAKAVGNLANEGQVEGVVNTGDIMLDACTLMLDTASEKSTFLKKYDLGSKEYVLATIHRAENTDSIVRLTEIVRALASIANECRVVLPLHPRTKAMLDQYNLNRDLGKVQIIEPIGYFDMLVAQKNAHVIVTDSGGVQKEAYFVRTPCITIRDQTEWTETVDAGWNTLVTAQCDLILRQYKITSWPNEQANCFGDGSAAVKIADDLYRYLT